MVVESEQTALLKGHRHTGSVLATLAGSQPPPTHPPTQLLHRQEKLDVLGLVAGIVLLQHIQ